MSNASSSVPDTTCRDTILLVDDEPWLLNGIKRLFRLEGFTIRCATSGEEALAVLRTHPIRVIVEDYRMPGMDGVKLLERVQAPSGHRQDFVDGVCGTGHGEPGHPARDCVSAVFQTLSHFRLGHDDSAGLLLPDDRGGYAGSGAP